MNSPIVTLNVVEVAADGSRIPIRVELDQPRPHERGGWACKVSVDGYDSFSHDVAGEDSLQALCLALRMVRFHLGRPLSRGSRLVYPDASGDLPLQAYFEEPLNESPSA